MNHNWWQGGYNNYPVAGNNVFGGVGVPFQQMPWSGANAYAQEVGSTPWKGQSKHIYLHPILAVDTTLLRYDLRKKAHLSIPTNDFPWTIDIKSPQPITVGAVWDSLHAAMQQDIVDSEWGVIVLDKKLRAIVEKAAKKRIEAGGHSSSKKMKRIDWLGEYTCLKGLDRDEGFEKARLLPGDKDCADTWVVKMCAQ
ncbi:hypothetical protein F5146DRAFT_1132304 [Armillaria mellea]|nr:hypothetical protein F5146DRAFT_1132304 [Armillaria mellea]